MKNNGGLVMKKNKKKIKLLVAILIILLLIASIIGIRRFMTRKPKNNEINNNVEFSINENKAEKLICKNNVQNVEVNKIEIYEVEKEYYMVLSLTNNSDNNQIDVPLNLNFVNKAGDVIFETGTVKKVLPKWNLDNVYFKITKEIKNMVENESEIDFIELSIK